MITPRKWGLFKYFKKFSILSDIIFPTHCPILGIELIKGGTGVQTFNSPSIDRIDPNKGYIKGRKKFNKYIG